MASGRTRQFDAEEALDKALNLFWARGYEGATLPALTNAMGVNRPSLYAAFGDKRSLYGKVLEGYREAADLGMEAALDPARPLREGLRRVYRMAMSLYLPGNGEIARGGFLIGTAVTEAVLDAGLREALANAFQGFDKAFETRFSQAKAQGEIGPAADPEIVHM